MSEAEVEELRRGYAALNRGDMSVVLGLLDSQLEWHEPGPSPEAGAHRGRDSFERFLGGWLESFEGFRVEPDRQLGPRRTLLLAVRGCGRGALTPPGTDPYARSPT